MLRTRIRRRTSLLLPLTVLLFLLTGCVSVNSTMVDPSVSYAPVPNDQVRLFESEDEVPTEYERVAIFHAEGADNWTDQSDMLEKLREEAAKKGCNGLILGEIEEAGTGEKVANALLGTGADREGRAVGIRWGDLNEEDESAEPGDEGSTTSEAGSGDDESGLPHYHISVN